MCYNWSGKVKMVKIAGNKTNLYNPFKLFCDQFKTKCKNCTSVTCQFWNINGVPCNYGSTNTHVWYPANQKPKCCTSSSHLTLIIQTPWVFKLNCHGFTYCLCFMRVGIIWFYPFKPAIFLVMLYTSTFG